MRLITLLLLAFQLGLSVGVQAQSASRKVKVSVLVPLFLDSAFNGNTYKLGNNNLPRYMMPGLEFYNGVLMAVDSLQKEGQQVTVMIHDTKSREKSLSLLLVEPEIAASDFIIGAFTTKDELKKVADFAAEKNIPLLSATYPNDGGITGNPNMALINPTLATHVEGVFKFVQRNYSLDNIVLLKRKGDAMDKYIADMLVEASKKYKALPIKWKYIETSEAFNPQEVISHLDSTKKNIIIGATLNENFAANIARTLNGVKATYQATVIGMPNWDNMPALNRPDTRNIEVVYSTVYGFKRSEKTLATIVSAYKVKMNGRASDMVLKGYEALFHFTKLYIKHDSSFMASLSDKEFKIANDFDFQPVSLKGTSTDYYENKKLYFIKKQDGVIKLVN